MIRIYVEGFFDGTWERYQELYGYVPDLVTEEQVWNFIINQDYDYDPIVLVWSEF